MKEIFKQLETNEKRIIIMARIFVIISFFILIGVYVNVFLINILLAGLVVIMNYIAIKGDNTCLKD